MEHAKARARKCDRDRGMILCREISDSNYSLKRGRIVREGSRSSSYPDSGAKDESD